MYVGYVVIYDNGNIMAFNPAGSPIHALSGSGLVAANKILRGFSGEDFYTGNWHEQTRGESITRSEFMRLVRENLPDV